MLKQQINYLLKRSNTPRTIKAIDIFSRRSDKHIYQLNSTFLFNPASNLKIVTTSFALQSLGIYHKFKTSFMTSGVQNGGHLAGDLLVAACGDPLIDHNDLDSVARIISSNGIRQIDGNIIIDISKFDTLEWGSGWMWDDEPSDYQMFISPACLDHNTISVEVSLDSASNKLDVRTKPATKFVRIVSTAAPDTIDSLYVTREMEDDTNIVSVSGKYSRYLSASEYAFSVRHPAEYFGTVLRERLESHGINVGGRVIVKSSDMKSWYRRELDTLFVLENPIDTVVTYVNKVSDNLGAECLLREVPSELYNCAGSAENGIKFEKVFLEGCGIDSTEYYIVDGSGLSHYDLLTPEAIVKVLSHDLDQQFRDVFMRSLPVSGVDGTLNRRMTSDVTRGKVLAKTGSIGGVSTLSGYVLLPRDTLVFSMMMQNYVARGDSLRALQDSMCAMLSLYNSKAAIFRSGLERHNVGSFRPVHVRRESHKGKFRKIRRKQLPSRIEKNETHAR